MILVVAIGAVAGLAAMTVLVVRVRPLDPASDPAPAQYRAADQRRVPADRASRLSVIVPARNEGRSLPLLLADLGHQSSPPFEVIVVDDDSDDDTARVAMEAGGAAADRTGAEIDVVVERVEVTPPGWNPKVWAMTLGAERATGEVLVFLDADVRLAPDALRALTEAARARTATAGSPGLISVAPHHRAEGPIEAMSAVCNVVAVAGGGPGLTGRHSRGAVGSCLLVDADTYHRIGGHRATPATIVDDLDLAATARRAQVPVTLYRGGDLVTMRSYPEGLRQLFRGWVKNLAAGAGHTRPAVGLIVGWWVTSMLSPLILAAQGRFVAAALLWAAAGLHLLAITSLVGRFDRRVVGPLAPLVALFFSAMTATSLARALTGRPTDWKGRNLTSHGLEVSRDAG